MILATGCEPIAPPKRDGLAMFDIEEELMHGYCKSGCTTPPTVVVEGEPVCRQCAREMGA